MFLKRGNIFVGRLFTYITSVNEKSILFVFLEPH